MTVIDDDSTASAALSSSAAETATVSRASVHAAIAAAQDAVKAAKLFHRRIADLASTANDFASALDTLHSTAHVVEPAAKSLAAAADLHRNVAKHHAALADALRDDFESPILRQLSAHAKRIDDNEKMLDKDSRRIQDDIGKTEQRMSKGRKKDLTAFHQSLADMQRLATELENVKQSGVRRMLDDERRHLMFLVQKTAGILKSEFDHFTTLANLSRDATSDMVAVAFAPPGKMLDPAERQRVVDTYLGMGGNGPSLNHRASTISRRTVESAVIGQDESAFHRTNTVSSLPVDIMTRANRSTTNASTSSNPMLPPAAQSLQSSTSVISNEDSQSSGVRSSRAMSANWNPAIEESLKRLNMAASQSFGNLATSDHVNNRPSSAMSDESKQKTATANDGRSSQRVSSDSNTSATKPSLSSLDLVVAMHDFSARTDRELTFKKGDILFVKQRQENWLYATHYTLDSSMATGAPTGTAQKSGWVPVSYVSKYEASVGK